MTKFKVIAYRPFNFFLRRVLIAPVLVCSLFSLVYAQEKNDKENKTDKLDAIVVFGTSMGQVDQAFNPKKISKDKIETFQFTDVNRALKQSSGVYIREEDGEGLRPNIGLRGTNPDRSKKVVILEDGILIGPAPYSAPAAYYTPNMNHVQGLEIWKGFSAIHIGPNSIGGAVNYVSTSLSASPEGEFRLMGGSFNTWNSRLKYSAPTSFGGYLIEGSYISSDGFKDIDGKGEAGFEKAEVQAKLKWDLNREGAYEHSLQFNLGYSYEDSNETYLGLSLEDFNSNPYKRYMSSGLDEMLWNHQKYQVHHNIQLADTTILSTSIYRNDFHRDWHRIDRFRGGPDLRSLLANPSSSPFFYDVLRGHLNSEDLGQNAELVMASNDRVFYSQGVQSTLSGMYHQGEVSVSPDVFIRFHQDKITRNHTSDRYEVYLGEMLRTLDPTQLDSSERHTSTALTIAAKTSVEFLKWNITPVLRYEHVAFDFEDDLNSTRNQKRNDNIIIPGLSALYKWHSDFSTAVSYNKAATLSGLSVSGNEVKEEADNYEFQLKYRNLKNLIEADFTGFFSDYQNITGTCTVSSGCTGSPLGVAFNGGQAHIYGVETSATKGFFVKKVYVPVQANITFLKARFNSEFSSSNHEWGIGTVNSGDPLPYIPEWQYSLSIGVETARLKNALALTYQSGMFDQSIDNGDRIEIPSYTVLDLAGSYSINENFQMNYKIDNILGKEYIVAARPFGFRPGKKQAFYLGATHKF